MINLTLAATCILALIIGTSCSSAKTKTEKNDIPIEIFENYCTKNHGENMRAFAFAVEDKGISHTRFFCTSETTDKNLDSIPGFQEARIKREAAKTDLGKNKYDSIAWNLMNSYLKGKCPESWKSEIFMSPLGWKCTSPDFPISKLCEGGTFFMGKRDSKPGPVLCYKHSEKQD